jgi:DNA helicase-2/ATP-dependent DNA helicase PcrA
MKISNTQYAAINQIIGNTAVIAGPGSGKTTTTVEAIHHDISKLPGGQENQARVIAITFTNRAAQQLREKLAERRITPYHVGTLHSFCLRIVSAASPTGRVALLDEESAAETIAAVAKTMRSSCTASQVQDVMQGKKPGKPEILTVIKAYHKLLRQSQAADFNSLLTDALQLLRGGFLGARPPAPWTDRGWLLYVDEFQDSAPIDLAIYDAMITERMWIVGDPDQNIFEWRGSRLENIIEITKRTGWITNYLPENFRSRPEIVDAATRVIRNNQTRLNYEPIVTRPAGGTVTVRTYQYPEQEVDEIRKAIADPQLPGTWGILTRYNAHRIEIDKALQLGGIYTGEPQEELPAGYRLGMAWLGMLANPASRIAHDVLMRAEYGTATAQKSMEGGQRLIAKTWPDKWDSIDQLLGYLQTRGVSAPFAEMLWAAHQATGSLDPSQLALACQPGIRERPSRVKVLTMHAAKGLEFDHVWLAATDLATAPKQIEQERRVFYVGMTRARETLWMSGVEWRTNPYTKRPERRIQSPFIPRTVEI